MNSSDIIFQKRRHGLSFAGVNRERKMKKNRFWFFALLAALFLYVGVNVFVQQPAIAQKKAEIENMKSKSEEARREGEKLQKEIKQSETDSYIEKRARELGLLKNNEKVFIDVDN